MSNQYRVGGDRWVRVRQSASTDGDILGGAKTGSVVEVVDIAANWARVALVAGGVALGTEGVIDTPAYGWMFAPLLSAVNVVTPPTTKDVPLGMAVVYNRDSAFAAAKAGCRFFSIVGNPALGSQVKDAYPDAIVMVRPYLNQVGSLPSVSYVMSQLNGAMDPRLIYSGINESDQVNQSLAGLKTRAPFDVAMAKAVATASGARYAAGSFSVGCPDTTSVDIVAVLKSLYAPHYNSGLFSLDVHLYSPNMGHIFRADGDQEWYETRWHHYFTKCGFNPQSTSNIYCSETGVDEGSVGGFKAHNATAQQVVAWGKQFVALAGAPIIVDGVQHESPMVGAAIFQIGDPSGWAGYDMTTYLAELGEVY